ncbi:MAG: 4Fe-4S dicluster domain-containing protein, partial [Caldimonas sp.]
RKFDAGTMCPSFRVTRDEQHLTRGRANTLRLALSGQLAAPGSKRERDGDGFAHAAVREALDLCVGCKGCKRDCPTGIDMAKMKLEFTAHDKARHGHTLKDRLIANLPDYARHASRVPRLLNLRNRIPALARAAERWTGLSARRSLPRWRADTFWQLAPTLGLASREATLTATKAAVLFVDTFNATFETENAVAAVRVLQAAGYAVHVAGRRERPLCCGRTYLAAGMPKQAQAKARELLDAYLPFAERGICIVGLEPSCLLTLRDEMQVMGLGARAATLAEHALLFEEFIAREARAGRFAPKLNATDRQILVHGHCHQKAFGAVQPILDVLRLIPGARPELIESSCCGMAGSFGYEANHHEISMQMAELSLLPAVRNAPDALIVADGTSCRHQIADGAGRAAVHVARVLQDHLA